MKKIILIVLALSLLFGCATGTEVIIEETTAPATAEKPTEPTFAWEMNRNAALSEQLSNAAEGTDITAVVVVKNGAIVGEYYKEGYNETSLLRLHSCTKSVTSALVGIALEEGLIEDVDTPISDYFPQIIGNKYQEEITIRHLLEQTAGIEWPEWGTGGTMWLSFVLSENWVDYVLSRPMAAKPGAVFNYSTGNTHLLSAILDQVDDDALAFADGRLFAPLGIENYEFNSDPQGIIDGGSGLSLTARDAAKFGQLFLQNGKWNGRQIVPAAWVGESTRPHAAGYNRYGKYGYQWFVKQFGEYDAYYAVGHGGQYIIVVPALELVTAINSRTFGNIYTPQTIFQEYILAACK